RKVAVLPAPEHDSTLRSFGSEDAADGRCQAPPARRLSRELFSADLRQRVEAGPAVVLGSAPCRADPSPRLEPLQRGVKGAVFDQQLVAGGLLNRPRDALAVLRPEYQHPQDQQIERALEQREAFLFFSGRHFTRVCARSGKMSTRD